MSIERDTSERAPSDAEIIRRAQKAERLDLRVCTVGRVTRYDASKGLVDVQPLIKDVYVDEKDARQAESFPIVANCVVQYFGAGGFRITVPISDGNLTIEGKTVAATLGTLIHPDRSIDRWLSGHGQEVDPEIDHDHALTDAIFIPGLMPFGSPWSSMPTDHMTVGADAGVQIHFHDSTISIGDESGNDFIALAQKCDDAIAAFYTFFNDIFGSLSSPLVTPAVGGPDPVYTALKARIATYLSANPTKWPPPSVAASQGKVK